MPKCSPVTNAFLKIRAQNREGAGEGGHAGKGPMLESEDPAFPGPHPTYQLGQLKVEEPLLPHL